MEILLIWKNFSVILIYLFFYSLQAFKCRDKSFLYCGTQKFASLRAGHKNSQVYGRATKIREFTGGPQKFASLRAGHKNSQVYGRATKIRKFTGGPQKFNYNCSAKKVNNYSGKLLFSVTNLNYKIIHDKIEF